ncbi:peptidylprolyl isomerase [Parabacteroides sp. APC149_11_2_Y6]
MKKILAVFFLTCLSCAVMAQENVIDEIVWVVGDDAILRSDVESQRLYLQNEGQRFDGDPYCVIPEEMAIQKLYLNQAKLDSVEVDENQVIQQADQWVNWAINQIGSKEKVEEYFNKKISQIKEEQKEKFREQQTVQRMQRELVGDIKLTPSEVRRYYNNLSKDSLPTIPTTVEVQIITMEPKIPLEEIDAIKARLRQFTDDVNTGKYEFSTLARLYSEDPGSAMKGGELGFTGKGLLAPEFANVAFNLNDPKKVSQIVQTEYGYHIIQLIEKRGDRINCRHILLKPKVSEKELTATTARMDSLYNDLQDKKFTFEEAATFLSSDKDTRNNKGLMVNLKSEGNNNGTPKFEMAELPQEIGKIVDNMEVGDISKPFTMITDKQKDVVAIVKLKSRVEHHKANLADDYQALKTIVEAKKREELLKNWIVKKQKSTYVRISDGWRNCDFKYPGWIKE